MKSLDKPKVKFNIICVVDSYRKKGDREVCLSINQQNKNIRGWFLESELKKIFTEIEVIYKK